MELGLYTFGDITPDPQTGRTAGVRERYAEIVAAAKLADEAGSMSSASASITVSMWRFPRRPW